MSVRVLHTGWLVKSPPLERAANPILKARWRRRFFVLQECGGRHQLNYYVDEKSFLKRPKSPKGVIELDECEQVDVGLTSQRLEHMFDIKTPARVFYLAADTDEEMNVWVAKVCGACGLKGAQEDDEEADLDAGFTTMDLSSRGGAQSRVAAVSASMKNNNEPPYISSPYIHISTCYTGGQPPKQPPGSTSSSNNSKLYQCSSSNTTMKLSNYDLGDDSVFLSDSPPRPAARTQKPPGRPPKPPHLMNGPVAATRVNESVRSDNYANSDEMQDIMGEPSRIPQPPTTTPKLTNADFLSGTENSLKAPAVARSLKPGRDRLAQKSATLQPANKRLPRSEHRLNSSSSQFATMIPGGFKAPPVERALKPRNTVVSPFDWSKSSQQFFSSGDFSSGDDSLDGDPERKQQRRRHSMSYEEDEQIYFYMPSVESAGGHLPTMIPAKKYEQAASIAYIDLDLPPPASDDSSKISNVKSSAASEQYHSIDFNRTEAFNKTRHKAEEKYKKNEGE